MGTLLTAAQAAPGPGSMFPIILMYVVIFGVFFYGIIIDITDDTVIVEFGNNKNCRIPMQKSAIAQVEKADAESAPEPAKKK